MKNYLSSAWFLLIFVVIIWGSNWPIMKIGLQFIDPLWFTVARLSIALVVISIVLILLKRFKLPHRGDAPIVLGVGIMQYAIFVTLINLGLTEVSAGRAALLAYTTPLWIAPGAHFLLKEKISGLKITGICLGLVGLMVLFNPFNFDWSDSSVVKGNAMLLMGALVWALSILHVRKHHWHGSVLELTPWQIMVSLIIVVPVAWFSETREVEWNNGLVLILLYNGVMATALAQWASIRITQLLPAVTVSLGFLMVPVAGIIASSYWLSEPFTLTLGLGMALIMSGLMLQTTLGKR